MNQLFNDAFKERYNQIYKNIISKNYNFSIRKNIKNNNGEIIIMNDNKVLYKLNFEFNIVHIDDRETDLKPYYQFFKIIDDIPEELNHEQKIQCFLCEGEGVIEIEDNDIDKFLVHKGMDELIHHIKILRKKNLDLEIKKKKLNDRLK